MFLHIFTSSVDCTLLSSPSASLSLPSIFISLEHLWNCTEVNSTCDSLQSASKKNACISYVCCIMIAALIQILWNSVQREKKKMKQESAQEVRWCAHKKNSMLLFFRLRFYFCFSTLLLQVQHRHDAAFEKFEYNSPFPLMFSDFNSGPTSTHSAIEWETQGEGGKSKRIRRVFSGAAAKSWTEKYRKIREWIFHLFFFSSLLWPLLFILRCCIHIFSFFSLSILAPAHNESTMDITQQQPELHPWTGEKHGVVEERWKKRDESERAKAGMQHIIHRSRSVVRAEQNRVRISAPKRLRCSVMVCADMMIFSDERCSVQRMCILIAPK